MTHAWYQQLGLSHRQRDEAAGRDVRTIETRDQKQHAALRRRWPAIAAATRALSHDYNEGAGVDVLTVIDDTSEGSGDLPRTRRRGAYAPRNSTRGVSLAL